MAIPTNKFVEGRVAKKAAKSVSGMTSQIRKVFCLDMSKLATRCDTRVVNVKGVEPPQKCGRASVRAQKKNLEENEETEEVLI